MDEDPKIETEGEGGDQEPIDEQNEENMEGSPGDTKN